MNPTDWQYTHQRQWESLDPNDNERPHTMMGTNEEMEHHHPSSHRHGSYRLNSNHDHLNPEMVTSDSDSESAELKIDEELARKRRELQQIEKQIRLKKPTSKMSSTYNNRPLKERVNGILQQMWPEGFLAKAYSTPDHLQSPKPVEKTNTSTLNKDDHPLRLRVKALMNRHHDSGVLDSHGEVPVFQPPPSCESPSTTVTENHVVDKGFQRFLSVLNKGVDIEMLTKIVNGDNELPPTGQELLHSQPPVVKEKSDVCKSERKRQRDHRSCSGKTELSSQETSNREGKRNVQPEDESTHRDERGGRQFVSSRRSRSPPVVEAKKPKLGHHQEDLENILKTIGFSLDADDMCKLAERTQERLYGIKHDTKQRLDSTGVSEKRQQNLKNPPSPSSSFTSVSDGPSSSPSRHQHSRSKTFRAIPTYISHHAASAIPMYNSDTARAVPTYNIQQQHPLKEELNRIRKAIALVNCDPANHSEKEHKFLLELMKKEQNILKRLEQNSDLSPSEGQTGQQSDLCYPHTINTVQHSEYTGYHSDYSNGASSTAWNYGSNVIPPSSFSYPPGFCNYSSTPLCPSADNGALLGQDYPHQYPHPYPPAGCNTALGHSYSSTDLSQTGQRSSPHSLPIDSHYQTKTMALPKHETVFSNLKLHNLKNKFYLKQEIDKIKKVITLVNCDPANNSEKGHVSQALTGKELNILYRLSTYQTCQTVSANTAKRQTKISKLNNDLNYIRKNIAQVKADPLNNSEELQKILEKLAVAERKILEELEKISGSGQTGQQSAVNTVTKATFQRRNQKS